MRFLKEQHLLIFLLLFAVVLRFWNFSEIPFTYDELSTVYRVSSDDSEVIKERILADNHPPGHHLILLFMKEVFGNQEWIMKLPFLVFGTLTVLLTYVLGKKLFNKNTGLLAALVLTFSQFHLMQSQIARPYGIGLFFVLLSAYVLLRLSEANTRRWQLAFLSGLLISIVGCLHYMALLTVALFWFVIFLSKKDKGDMHFLSVPLVALALYVPMFSFLFSQLGHDGLSTILGIQKPEFLAVFFFRIFNYSWLFLSFGILAIATLWSFDISKNKNRLIVGLAFFLPLLVIWLYSILRNPILNERSLFFALPFLLLLIFSFVSSKRSVRFYSVFLALGLTGFFSLIYGRNHYTLFYHQGFDEVAESIIENNGEETLNIVNYNPETYEWIIEKHPDFRKLSVLNPDSTVSTSSLIQRIQSESWSQIQLANTAEYYPFPLELIPLVEDLGFTQIEQENYHLGFYRLYSQSGNDQNSTHHSGISKNETFSMAENEFGAEINEDLKGLIDSSSDLIFAKAEFQADQSLNAGLVMELWEEEERIFYQFTPLDVHLIEGEFSGKVYSALDLSDFKNVFDLKVKAYIWNKDREPFILNSLKLWSAPGNPIKYSLVQPKKKS